MTDEHEVNFVEDGHRVVFDWVKDEIKLTVQCPNATRESLCNIGRSQCCVATWIGVYGSSINIGSSRITGPVEVAWTALVGWSDLDPKYKNIWVVPLNDPEYVASKMR